MVDDVLFGKAEIIERCLKRIQDIYSSKAGNFLKDQTKQDAILLNIERACQATIDAGFRIVRMKKLGIPKETRDVFDLLEREKVIDSVLSAALKKMVGFRNVAIHDYRDLDLKLVQKLIEEDFQDLRAFVKVLVS